MSEIRVNNIRNEVGTGPTTFPSGITGFVNTSIINSSDGSSNAIVIGSNGEVTKPNQPSGTLLFTGDQAVGDGVFDYYNGTYNVKGGITANTTNGRITVPVSGDYLITFMYNGTTTASGQTGDGVGYQLEVNGTPYISNNSGDDAEYSPFVGHRDFGEEWAYTLSNIVSLNANDYIRVNITNFSSNTSRWRSAFLTAYLFA